MSKDKSNLSLDKELQELFEACEKGELEKVKSLVGQNPDLVNAQNERGITALQATAAYKQTAIAEFLIDNKADIEKTDKEGLTPLHWAASSGNNSKILELLLNKGAKIDVRDQEGSTALHFAAESGHTENIQLLLDKGDSIEEKNHNDHTPLILATKSQNTEAVGLLLDKGAKANLETVHTLLEGMPEDREVAKVLIKKRRFDLNKINYNSVNYHETPLEGAIKTNDHGMVKTLLEGGADPNHVGDIDQTPLRLAIASKNTEIVKILLEGGADPNAPDRKGQTSLHAAVQKGDKELVQLLVEKGADLLIKDKDGHTPTDLLKENVEKNRQNVASKEQLKDSDKTSDQEKNTIRRIMQRSNSVDSGISQEPQRVIKSSASFGDQPRQGIDPDAFIMPKPLSLSTPQPTSRDRKSVV